MRDAPEGLAPSATCAEAMQLKCGSCGQAFGVPPAHAQVRCPICKTVNAVPASALPLGHYTQALDQRPTPALHSIAPAPTGRKRALLVGVNYFGTSAELKGCINDVHRSRGLLTRLYGFPTDPEHMRVLTDDQSSSSSCPTRANLVEGLKWLVAEAQPGDALFFHFSGHGAQQEDPTYREEDGYDETICPSDFQATGMIVDDEIFDLIVAPLPSGAKLTAVLDCCHSGTVLELPFTWHPTGWAEDDNPCHSAGDVLLLSGCQEEQTSSDGGGSYMRPMGAMTTALWNTLERMPTPNCSELMDALRRELWTGGFEQNPCLTSSQRFDLHGRRFSISDGMLGNQNPMLGRHLRKKKHPARPNLMQGPLGELLLSSAMGFLSSALLGGHGPTHSLLSGLVMDGKGRGGEEGGAPLQAGGELAGGQALLPFGTQAGGELAGGPRSPQEIGSSHDLQAWGRAGNEEDEETPFDEEEEDSNAYDEDVYQDRNEDDDFIYEDDDIDEFDFG